MQVAILAGGLATRLKGLTSNRPKSMIKIQGKPFLEYQLELLHKRGIRDVVLCIGHMGRQIKDYFKDGKSYDMNISYSCEDKLLGTGGALKNAKDLLEDVFFTMYGDSYLSLDLPDVMRYFKCRDKLALMTVYKNHDLCDRSNTVIKENLVKKFSKGKKTADMVFIEYGANIFRKAVLNLIPENRFYPLENLFPKLIEKEELLAFESKERFYEVGSPNGLREFREYVKGAN